MILKSKTPKAPPLKSEHLLALLLAIAELVVTDKAIQLEEKKIFKDKKGEDKTVINFCQYVCLLRKNEQIYQESIKTHKRIG